MKVNHHKQLFSLRNSCDFVCMWLAVYVKSYQGPECRRMILTHRTDPRIGRSGQGLKFCKVFSPGSPPKKGLR